VSFIFEATSPMQVEDGRKSAVELGADAADVHLRAGDAYGAAAAGIPL
jgi:hypothetical protein